MHSKLSIAQAVAVATPCCPAPVSAIILFFPSLFANKACPSFDATEEYCYISEKEYEKNN